MKANELRLGNLVLYSDKNETPIPTTINIDISDLILLNNSVKDVLYEPIPLTEEWLLRMGFEKKENGLFTKKLEYIYNSLKYCEDYKIWIYYNDDNDAACNAIADLNYVHELQNLYFALTKEELTMK